MENEDVILIIKELEQVAQDYYRSIIDMIMKYGTLSHGKYFLYHYFVEDIKGTRLLVDVMTGQTLAHSVG